MPGSRRLRAPRGGSRAPEPLAHEGTPAGRGRPARPPPRPPQPCFGHRRISSRGRFCGPAMGGGPACKPRAALDAGRLSAVVGAGRRVHLKGTRLGAAWLSPRGRRWAGTQPARRRGSLAVEAPGDEDAGPPPAWGAPGVHLGTGAPGLMASSEPVREGLFFPLKPE